MRIDIIGSSRELFGSDRSAVRLAVVLEALGHEVTLVLPVGRPERGLGAYAASRGIDVAEAGTTIVSSRGIEGLPLTGRRFQRFQQPKPDVTIYNSAAVVRCNRPSGRKIVIVREWLTRASVSHRALVTWHETTTNAVVGVSRGVLAQWRAMARQRVPQFLCWNWLEPEDTASAEHFREAGPSDRSGIVCLGRFNAWKGQELLAEAYRRAFGAAETRPRLTFVGMQSGTEFAARAERLAQQGSVSGWTVEPFAAEPLAQLAKAALVVVPSLHPEPFGVVLLEGLACGCSVLACDGGGPSDLEPLFPGALSLSSRTPAQLADRMLVWWQGGGRPQSPQVFAASEQTLADVFSVGAATERWQDILAAEAITQPR